MACGDFAEGFVPAASNGPPSLWPAEALATAGMQRGTRLTVRESCDDSQHDDAGLAPPPLPPRVTDAVTYERFNLHDDLGRERHCPYLCRPAFSFARLRMRRDGNVSYRVKKASRVAGTHVECRHDAIPDTTAGPRGEVEFS